MKTKDKIIALSIIFGLCAWVIDALIDSFMFYEKTVLELLIYDVPTVEIYVRSALLVVFIALGITISRIMAKGKRVEEALEESEERYRSLFEVAKDAIFLNGCDGEVYRCQSGGLRIPRV